jgi:hypothetical protein
MSTPPHFQRHFSASSSPVLSWKSFLRVSTAILLLAAAGLYAQAIPSSSRLFEVSSFASFGIVHTNSNELGPAYAHAADTGYVFGTDLVHHFRILQPSLELRSTFTNGNVVRERMLGGGLGVEKAIRRVTPYGDFLVGAGVVTYPGNKSLPYDNSVVFQYGGGVNVRMLGPWALRLDVQEQSWHTGVEVPRFYPTSFTGGFSYRPRPRGYVTR